MLSDLGEDLLESERRLFHEEYDLYFMTEETKPNKIGEPYLLHAPSFKTGVLLLHGLMAAPEEVREWADFLYSKGYTVYAPRLAGHGTSAVDLSTRHFDEWMASVDRGHEILKTCCKQIVVAGFSTGAGLALYQVLQKPDDFNAVVSISAPLKFQGVSVRFVEALHLWNRLCGKLGVSRLRMEYVKNHPDNPEINYNRCPVQSLVEVKALMQSVYKSLPSLAVPSLIMQGENDPKVDGRSGRMLFKRITHPEKQYHGVDYHLHGIIRGKIAGGVFDEVEKFLMSLG